MRGGSRCTTGVRALPGVTCAEPLGAFYVFPNTAGLYGRRTAGGALLGGSMDLSTALLAEANVATVPGVAFGDDAYIRLSYATSNDRIAEAIRRLVSFVAALT